MNYRDIVERTFNFSVNLVNFCKKINNKELAVQIIVKQLIRAGTSIGANTTEGRASSSRKDFINFHYHALKSSRETLYWLKLLKAQNASPLEAQINIPIAEADEISRVLGKIVVNARKT